MPLVTVWLTSYNHGAFIGATIESILGQTYRDFELCIIDDCSTDNSWDVICAYAEMDSRIIPIRHEVNHNDENCALPLHEDMINGEYLAIAHSDDMWKPTKLEKQIAYLVDHQDVCACFTWAELIDDAGNGIESSGASVFDCGNRSSAEWLRLLFFQGNRLCHPSLLIRFEAYHEYGLYTHGFTSLPDYVKWIRLCMRANIHIIEERLVRFRVHADYSNMSADTPLNRSQTAFELFLAMREFEHIDNYNTLASVFPEVIAYSKKEDHIIPYLIARTALDHGTLLAHWAYGLESINALLQDEETRSIIINQYGYSMLDYIRDKKSHPVFSAEGAVCTCSAYIDFGNGFSEEHRYPQLVTVPDSGPLVVEWDLGRLCKGKKPRAIRIDPDEGAIRLFKNVKVFLDRKPLAFSMPDGCVLVENDWNMCLSLDPLFVLEGITQIGLLRCEFETRVPNQSDWRKVYDRISGSRGLTRGLFSGRRRVV